MTRQEFLARAADHVLLLDGATGSNLRKAGMPVGISSEEWVLKSGERDCVCPYFWSKQNQSYEFWTGKAGNRDESAPSGNI